MGTPFVWDRVPFSHLFVKKKKKSLHFFEKWL